MGNKTIISVFLISLMIIYLLFYIINIKTFKESDNKTCIHEVCKYVELPFTEHEYYMVEGNDTSAYSFIFTQTEDNAALLEIYYSPYNKKIKFERELKTKDTTAFANGKEVRLVNKYYALDYQGILNEFRQCLSVFSNNNKKIIKSIRFRLADMTNLAITTTKKLAFDKNIRSIKHQDIDEALKKTTLTQDLNNLLIKYNLDVRSIHCQEEIFLIDESTFRNVCLIPPETSVPPHIVDVEILVKVSPIGMLTHFDP